LNDPQVAAATTTDATPSRHQLEQALMLELSQAVSSTLDLEAVLQVIADGTARLAGVETAAVYTFEGSELFMGATTPPLDPHTPEAVRWARIEDHPHIAEAIRSRAPLIVLDAPKAELSPSERMIVELRQLRSLLFLPFCVEQNPIGVLILGTKTDAHAFDVHEVNLCRTITNQLAVGVQNAKLHTRLKRYTIELEQQMAEQKRLEEQLRHAQKMEAVGQLAGGVAHDFNNLLQVIQGFTSLAIEDVPEGSSVRESLAFVLQASERAGLLVRQLLAFGRRQVLSLAVVDLNAIVDRMLPMLRPLLGENISIERRSESDLDLVEADANQVEQVLVNLCVNARDAMPDGGTVVVTTRTVLVDRRSAQELGLARAGAYVVLEVADSGCGMPPDILARVFEPFFTTKAPGRGTGLGLATVHGLVAQHHGGVQIDSKVGRGTCVAVYLPAARDTKPESLRVCALEAPRGTETILVAEDEPLVLELTRASLAAAGYTVLTATNGVEAIELAVARAQQLSLALLDVVMPQLGGEAVLRDLRKRLPGLPVIFATGHGWTALSNESISERVAILQKPYGRAALLHKVRAMIDAAK
jgi:signal transduction histidine kinase